MNKFNKLVSGILLTLLLFLSFAVAVKSVSAVGNKWFVSENGTGTDCSRTNPGPLQYCVEQKAQSGDTVYVEENSYGEFYHSDDPTDDNLLLIKKSIRLIGSCTWRSSGPISCETENKSSRLNGEYERRVIAIEGPGISVTIEGFTIFQGNAHNKSPLAGQFVMGAGGGIYAQDLVQLVLRNNHIWQNKASDTTFFQSRYAYGGGIFVSGVKRLDIQNNEFNFNMTSSKSSPVSIYGQGGGIHIRSCGIVNIKSNDISGNSVSNVHGIGAGLYLININNLNLYDNCITYQNALAIEQFSIIASALSLYNVDESSIKQNTFLNNYGYSTIDATNTVGEFTRNIVWDNRAGYEIQIYSEARASDLKVINNFLSGDFTIMSIDSLHPSTYPEVDISHNTFSLAEKAIVACEDCTVKINRNILTGLLIAIDLHPLTNFQIEDNLFWDNADNGQTGLVFWEGDPLFIDPSNGDFHLQPGSAAIDKVTGGFIKSDIDGQPRPMGFGIDLGADEFEDDIYLFLPIIQK